VEIGDAVRYSLNDRGQLLVNGAVAGQLQVVRFPTPTRMRHVGKSLLAETPDSGAPEEVEQPKVAVGFLERSNVNVVEEMSRMIEANRAYEVAAKTVTIQDELTSRLSSAFGRVS